MNWIKSIFKSGKGNPNKSREPRINSMAQKVDGFEESGLRSVGGDNPINRTEDDLLGRSRSAAHLADQILTLDSSRGLVVGVLGPWGSGKTSFVNLARLRLEGSGATVIDFNPWMFSGADQLIDWFFRELSTQLKLRPELSAVGKLMEDYGECFNGLGWVPVFGPWFERSKTLFKLLAQIFQRQNNGVSQRRTKVQDALAEIEFPIVVLIDDIDRLTYSEIRDIFKLVRLTASFPNVIYVLSFDRDRVETALSEQGIPGRGYLEKILQLVVDIPVLPHSVFTKEILRSIQAVLSNVEPSVFFDQNRWPDVFMEVIRPLFRNMRDLRRYAANIQGTVRERHRSGLSHYHPSIFLNVFEIFSPNPHLSWPSVFLTKFCPMPRSRSESTT